MNVTTKKPGGVVLELDMNQAEARVLATIMDYVGGASYGPRSVVDEIRKALEAQGVDWDSHKSYGSIILPDGWEDFRP